MAFIYFAVAVVGVIVVIAFAVVFLAMIQDEIPSENTSFPNSIFTFFGITAEDKAIMLVRTFFFGIGSGVVPKP